MWHVNHLKSLNKSGFNNSNEVVEGTEENNYILFQGERIIPCSSSLKYSHNEIPHEIDTLPGVIVITLLNISV